ncbi:uncharacterized protein LOC131856842 [Cryptomeria japonica]|uniref:uncharacterized protein LOC131856842 n=1 Tax=Cryptomeria japonica TaxID=3369 RepID=UPI0027DA3FB0|nr:uncharacterized protein LOC131856842 [Cryptomeria japonica]
MGTLKSSKSHALATNQGTKEQKGQSSNNNSKDKKQKNSKEKKDQTSVALKATNETQSFKGDKPKKEKSFSEGSNKAKENNKGKGKGKALVTFASSPSTWVLDLGASHYMASSKEEFASLEPCYLDGVKGYRFLHPTTHELFIERSVQFEEGSLSSLSTTSPTPSTLTLESLGIHDSSSDESDSPKQSSTSTSDAENNSKDSPPSSPSHHSEVDDSPPDSPSFSPLWAR